MKKSGDSTFIEKIINRVSQIKSSEKVGVRYMQRWEEEAIIKHDAHEEGRAEGREEGREEERLVSVKNVMRSFKVTAEQAMESLGIPEGEYEKYLSKL
ncbi:hypothetical protein [Pseudobutyrivibrio sp. ACV-2]|uniref:hypothetical protein n=1 Tax=Pseudobutyrivibrio sp. ACV-2 TaxID=1520801 RepID=UPI00147F751A|nr:hypothetical protein [Pseudobutyrivibrio sp. ACV-2]